MDSRNRSRLVALVATLTLIVAMSAPVAFAQSGGDAYRTEGPTLLDQSQGAPNANKSSNNPKAAGNDPVKSAGSSSDALPFTGLDIGLVAAAGASLMLMGVGMRRLTRAPDSV